MTNQFQVIDLKEQRPVKFYSSYKGAQRKADAMNLEYGAHRYAVRNALTGFTV